MPQPLIGDDVTVESRLESSAGLRLDEAEWLVAEVDLVLGRPRGIRIGEASDRDGQYFHYLAMWLFALARLGPNGSLDPNFGQGGVVTGQMRSLTADIVRSIAVQPDGKIVALGLVSVDEDGLNQGPLAHLVSLETSEALHLPS